jgi:TrmH family RNA methyltransferase
MGALFRLPILIVETMGDFLKTQKLSSYAAVPDRKAVPIADCSFVDGGIIVIGNEANGLSDEAILACSKKVTIPMKGRAESLNASAAATILLYEISRDNTN